MENLTLEQILNLDFKLRKDPILHPFDGSFVVADPSLLTPSSSNDKKWHMFFHTNLAVYHFISDDGISFNKVNKIVKNAMRPNINFIDGKYYLFYEKTRSLIMNLLSFLNIAKWKSSIYVKESSDLINWSNGHEVIGIDKDYHKIDGGGHSISNPYLLKVDNKYRLYYSSSLTFIKDCGFSEPTYISYAESDYVNKEYKSIDKPIIYPNKEDPYLNLCSGCLKVYKIKDGYIGIQNGIYEKDAKSHSAIILLSSKDGITFKFEKVLLEPSANDNTKWMKQYVYASHLVKEGNILRLYFNARDISNPVKGRECIGFVEASLEFENINR